VKYLQHPPEHHYGENKEWVPVMRPYWILKYKGYTEINEKEGKPHRKTPTQSKMYVKIRTDSC
jgi:hypothetical protein